MARLGMSCLSTRLVRRSKFILILAVFAIFVFFTNLYYLKNSPHLSVLVSGVSLRSLQLTNKTDLSLLANAGIKLSKVKLLRPQTARTEHKTRSCADKITLSPHGILLFKNISVQSRLGYARAAAEKLKNPGEEDEFYTLKKGFFTLYCNDELPIAKLRLHQGATNVVLQHWTRAVDIRNSSSLLLISTDQLQAYRGGYFLAIQRFEYANVYWTVIDLLDIFITAEYFGIDPAKLTIVLIDAHSACSLDPFWDILFMKTVKLEDEFFTSAKEVVLENLIWRYPRTRCPFLDRHRDSVKYIKRFRSFALSRFGIPMAKHQRDCSKLSLNVLVVFRRDYQNHPRNLKAVIDRKISNEREVLQEMKTAFPSFNVTGVQLDSLPLLNQLQLLASSDVFFGMHGAAHAFSIFMPPGGVVVEMFNFNADNWHMKHVATLAGHAHVSWINTDIKAYNRRTRSTKIPSGVPKKLLHQAIQELCP